MLLWMKCIVNKMSNSLMGIFVGIENSHITKTLLVVMIKPVAGKYRDVVCMSPIHNLNSEKLLKVWNNVIRVVTKIGFDVVLTMVDGHQSNISFYQNLTSSFSLQNDEMVIRNPCAPHNMIYLLFDTVQIFKNFYNNFLNYKIFHYPDFPVNPARYLFKARFSDIESLYDIEIQKAEKMAYKLNKKVLNPNSIEKANVQLAYACFHESTIYDLLYYSLNGYPHFKETAKFLEIIRDWFNVINVKSQYYGQGSRDNRRNAIHFNDREQLDFLCDFHSWLQTWSISRGNCFSGPTFHAAKVTTDNLVHVANYLLDKKNIEYVLFSAI